LFKEYCRPNAAALHEGRTNYESNGRQQHDSVQQSSSGLSTLFPSLSLSVSLSPHLFCFQIDAVEGSATLDFYLRLRWTDNRVDMPLFWAKMGKKVQFVDITSLYQDEVLAVWLPDIRFHDVSNVEYLAQVPSLALTCLLTSLMTTLSPSLSSHSLSLCLSLSVSLSLSLSLCLSLSLSLSLPH
jgi:hypothetical protein